MPRVEGLKLFLTKDPRGYILSITPPREFLGGHAQFYHMRWWRLTPPEVGRLRHRPGELQTIECRLVPVEGGK